jgi:hypothetical protein
MTEPVLLTFGVLFTVGFLAAGPAYFNKSPAAIAALVILCMTMAWFIAAAYHLVHKLAV